MNRETILRDHLKIWIGIAMELARDVETKNHIIDDLNYTVVHLLENQLNSHYNPNHK